MTAKALRAAPAFAVYASDDLARVAWYGLTVGERGLLESMGRVYWVDGRLPRDVRLLALACRLPPDEVSKHLTGNVLAHFEVDDTATDFLHHRELRRQLQNIERTRQAQSVGGKCGAIITNESRAAKRRAKARQGVTGTPASKDASAGAGMPAGQVRVPELKDRKELKSTLSLGNAHSYERDAWITEYSRAELQSGADDYQKARER